MLCRLYADQLAAEGMLVLLPDIFHGDALSEGFSKSQFAEWMQKHPQDMQVNQLDRLLTDMHQQYKPRSVSCIGFCWGGLHACMLASSDRVSAAVVAHGSFITKAVVEAVKQPLLFLFADKVSSNLTIHVLQRLSWLLSIDGYMPNIYQTCNVKTFATAAAATAAAIFERVYRCKRWWSVQDQMIPEGFRKEIEEILAKKQQPTKGKLYPGATHGWTIRGDPSDSKQREDAADAFAETVSWLKTHAA